VGLCEHGNKPSASINVWNFLVHERPQLIKDSAAWSSVALNVCTANL